MAAKKRTRWVTPRRLGGAGCLLGLALAAALVFFAYRQVSKVFGSYGPTDPSEYMTTEDVVVERGDIADGVRAYGNISPAREASLGFSKARCRVLEVPVSVGEPVQAGQVLVRLDEGALSRDLAKARADLLEAEDALADAKADGGAAEKAQLEVELAQARTALEKARRALADFDAGIGTPQAKRADAVAELESARRSLEELRANHEELDALELAYNEAQIAHGPLLVENPDERQRDDEWVLRIDMLNKGDAFHVAQVNYEQSLRQGEERIAKAERELARLDREIAAGSPAVERRLLAAAVQEAEAKVRHIQAQIAAVDESSLSADVAAAEAKVLKQEGIVADAEVALAEAELVAPFDGVVETLNVKVDDTISSASAVIKIIDTSSVRITAGFSDIDVHKLQAGQEVRVSFDAFQGQPPVTGRLGEIPLYGDYSSGMPRFEVPVEIDSSEMPLQVGMSANVYVPLERKEGVLLIPAAAMQFDGEGYFVWFVEGGKATQRKVRIGVSDGIQAEVLEGLNEGDTVRVPMYGPMGRGGRYW